MKKRFISVFLVLLLLPQIFIAATATSQQTLVVSPTFCWSDKAFTFDQLENGTYTYNLNTGSFGVMVPLSCKTLTSSAIVSFSFTLVATSGDSAASDPTVSMVTTSPTRVYSDYHHSKSFGSSRTGTTSDVITFPNVDMYLSVNRFSTGSNTVNNAVTCDVKMIIGRNCTIENFYIKYTVPSASCYISGSDVQVLLVDSSFDDLSLVISNIGSNVDRVSDGISDLNTNVINGTSDLKENIVNSLDDVKKSVNDVKDNMQASQEAADESFYEKLKNEIGDVGNDAVNSITEQLNIDVTPLQNALTSLYNSVSTHSTVATVVLPAGTVSVAGTDYKFWDEQSISLNDVAENEQMELLILPFRFSIYIGFVMYLWHWVKKIEDLVTLNRSDL